MLCFNWLRFNANLDFLLRLLKASSLHLLMVIHLPVGHAFFYSVYKPKVMALKVRDEDWVLDEVRCTRGR